VSMKTPTLVAFRQVRKQVGGFELKGFAQVHFFGGPWSVVSSPWSVVRGQ
jgi:hypothetical protein